MIFVVPLLISIKDYHLPQLNLMNALISQDSLSLEYLHPDRDFSNILNIIVIT